MSLDNNPTFVSEELKEMAQKITDVYKTFGVKIGSLIGAFKGSRVARFEFEVDPDTKLNKITMLRDDISLALSVPRVRIICPIPQKVAFAIEVANKTESFVEFDEVFTSQSFQDLKDNLRVALGKSVTNENVCLELSKAPHLLIGGKSCSGKTTLLKSIILSIIRSTTTSEAKLLLISPKKEELEVFENSNQLLSPIICDKDLALDALKNLCEECERRYKIFNDNSVKSIDAYNASSDEIMPKIVVIVDETSFLSGYNIRSFEASVCALAQKGRAAGIHIVLATGELNSKNITGIIKACIPTRIALSANNAMESRTVMDASDAECLLLKGDMLLCPMFGKPIRIQAPYLNDEQIKDFIEDQ